MAMRFRHLKKTSKEAVGVYRLVGLGEVPLGRMDRCPGRGLYGVWPSAPLSFPLSILHGRSAIHGRGLFCKRNIDAGEMVIEYSGIVIRSVLTDKREKFYDGKVGCTGHEDEVGEVGQSVGTEHLIPLHPSL